MIRLKFSPNEHRAQAFFEHQAGLTREAEEGLTLRAGDWEERRVAHPISATRCAIDAEAVAMLVFTGRPLRRVLDRP